jgi:eukaryotic-like serine/threonine-protein kinase
MADPRIGKLLSNRYRLVELVGQGAMGQVYQAEDKLLGGVIVAVKFLSQALLSHRMRDRFKAEARNSALLSTKSLHIVRVMDYGLDEQEVPYYVMEYLQGSSLGEIVATQNLPLPRFISLVRQICLGLSCAHQGIAVDGLIYPIIHRDIKPSNVLVLKDPGLGELVKILDFGIAKLLQNNSHHTGSYMGTLAYSSPEQMEGQELDERADIYSLGVMLFEMLTRKLPFQAETHSFGAWYKVHQFQSPDRFEQVNPNLKLPQVLENLVMKCLEKNPRNRPQSVTEILQILEPLEQRYSATQQISHRIHEILLKRPIDSEPPIDIAFGAAIYRGVPWPQDKPIAQIVFPQVWDTGDESFASVWVMLPQQEIENIQVGKLYNKYFKSFLCTMSPYPMMLWITAIYNPLHHEESGARWLRSYLDLKTEQGRKLTQLLIEKEKFKVACFALENPQHCMHVITLSLNSNQRSQLLDWILTSQNRPIVGDISRSKELLKTEFEKLKGKVSMELQKDTLPKASIFNFAG